MHGFKYKVMPPQRYAAPPKRVKTARRQDSTRYIVAEIYGCYRAGWASFSLCAIALAASSQGLVAPTVPRGARIVSAFDLCPSPEEQSLRSLGGLVYDAIVVVAAWPGRPRTDWVSVQFRDDGSDYNDDDDDDDESDEDAISDDDDDDDALDHDNLHDARSVGDDSTDADARWCVGRRGNALMGPPRGLMEAAACATGDDINEFIDAIAQHPQFPRRCTPSGLATPSGVRWWLRTKRPRIDGAFNVGRNGSLALACDECPDGKAQCPSCVGMWNRTRRLWPPIYDDVDGGDNNNASGQSHGVTTRRSAPLRQSVRRAASAIVAAQVPVVTEPVPSRSLTTTTAPAAQKASRIHARKSVNVPETQQQQQQQQQQQHRPEPAGARCYISGPRCGRHRCPSPCRRVDTGSTTHVWVHCDRGCRALFHRACWRAMGNVIPTAPDLAEPARVPCLTPDCWGHLARVVSFAPGASTLGRVEWEEAATKGIGDNTHDHDKSSGPCATSTWPGHVDNAGTIEDVVDTSAYGDIALRELGDAASHYASQDGGGNNGDENDDDDNIVASQDTIAAVATQDANKHTADNIIDLARPVAVYRKSALCDNDTRVQPKRTRVRSQKKQRLRARQKQTLAEWRDSVKTPETNPWAGDDTLWPAFFVAQETDAAFNQPHQCSARTAVSQCQARPTTAWRFAVWDPKCRMLSKGPVATPTTPAHV
nr:hypothetical protein [Pandoravirus aubagnensis]